VEVTEEGLADKLSTVMPHLDERQRRILAGAEARALGRGGIALVASVTGMSRSTVQKAVAEVDSGVEPQARVRGPGGGRPRLVDKDRTLLKDLKTLVDPATRGDPESPLRWTSKSTRTLAEELRAKGHRVSHVVVGELLRRKLGYTLQATQKSRETTSHPDRDGQFRYLNDQAASHLSAGQPVISVDTKKKELVGYYANKGQEWQPQGEPVQVSIYDFIDPEVGKAIPYGVYDVGHNEGWVSVGTDHDTAAFAVATIRRWWEIVGRASYPDAIRLLISADGGGSNGYRSRAWKVELAKLANNANLEITVCHLPPGTSKWNKVEHRLFSHISMNWRGRPLTTHQVVVDLIGATKTRSGLKVRAELDPTTYETGVKISDAELAAIPLRKHDFHPEWNYSVGQPA
jgi:hypothetical protein